MFNLTQEEVKNTINSYQKIIDRDIDIEWGTILVTAEDSIYDLCGTISTSFPISYLFEPEEMHKNIYRINRRKMEEECKKKEEEKKIKEALGGFST